MEKVELEQPQLDKINGSIRACENRLNNIDCNNYGVRLYDMKIKIDALEKKLDKLIYDLAIR